MLLLLLPSRRAQPKRTTLLLWSALAVSLAVGVLIGRSAALWQLHLCSSAQQPSQAQSSLAPAVSVFSADIDRQPASQTEDAEVERASAVPPFVQQLPPDWQERWWRADNGSGRANGTIADAHCLPFHATPDRPACPMPRTDDGLVREVHVAYSVCGRAVLEQAVTSLKSLILHRHASVTLHVWLLLSPHAE